ncbi:iron-containing alcohol dehydrogenase, partial [Acinetobacter baumannii]
SSLLASSVFTESLCLQALRLLFDNLERATIDGTDLDARSATLVASTMAGVAFTNSGVGMIHALSHAVGARYNTHHGATNSIFLPHGMAFNKE